MIDRQKLQMAQKRQLKNWHRADVVAAFHRRGTSLAELARANCRSEGALRQALSHPRTPSNKIIAAFLGLQLHEVWPEWFDQDDQLRPFKRRQPRRRPSSQKRGQKLALTGGCA